MNGLVVTPASVGVPEEAAPDATTSISQVVADPFSVQPRSAVVDVSLVDVKVEGSAHVGACAPVVVATGLEIQKPNSKLPLSL